jgi:hypothetical protein
MRRVQVIAHSKSEKEAEAALRLLAGAAVACRGAYRGTVAPVRNHRFIVQQRDMWLPERVPATGGGFPVWAIARAEPQAALRTTRSCRADQAAVSDQTCWLKFGNVQMAFMPTGLGPQLPFTGENCHSFQEKLLRRFNLQITRR